MILSPPRAAAFLAVALLSLSARRANAQPEAAPTPSASSAPAPSTPTPSAPSAPSAPGSSTPGAAPAEPTSKAPPPATVDAPTTSGEAAPSTSSNIDVRASSEVSGYADTNHVFVVSPTVAGTLSNPTAGWSATGRYLADVVSAASVDITTTASRRWEEVRHVGNVEGSYKPDTLGIAASADISVEPDYTSLTLGGTVSKDILKKSVTLLFGYDHRHDIAGRRGTPFSVFSRIIDHEGLKTGASFVLDRSTIFTLVGDVMLERGNSSKPYRYVPLFSPEVAATLPKGASVDLVNSVRVSARPLEQLPVERQRYVLSGRIARRYDSFTIRADERGYIDSWGLKATTTDARIIFDVSRRFEIGPHARFHIQTPVDFWKRAYIYQPGFDVPSLRTGDRELGGLMNITGGGMMRFHLGPVSNPQSWSLGFEANVTKTSYFDALYLTSRVSSVGAITLEADL